MTLFSDIFILPFEGNNFYRGKVTNDGLPLKKNAAYELLQKYCHNLRKFMLASVIQISNFFTLLANSQREKVSIFDDSTYDRSPLEGG